MAITRKPLSTPAKAVEDFVAGAPDAAADRPKRVRKGKKIQITLTIGEPLLDRVDALAIELNQSRAGVINLAILQLLENGLRLDS